MKMLSNEVIYSSGGLSEDYSEDAVSHISMWDTASTALKFIYCCVNLKFNYKTKLGVHALR